MRNDALKLIGIIAMTIDHIGWLFFPNIVLFRIIGRIAFPIFAYQISVGYRNTSNVYKYMARLFIFALISQIPYGLLANQLNIMFTLLIGLIMIQLRQINTILSLLPLFLTYCIDIDYGIYGLLTIYGFYVFQDIRLFFIVLNTILYKPLQFFSIMALPILNYEFKTPLMLHKYFFYWYYPLHLLFLYCLRELCAWCMY